MGVRSFVQNIKSGNVSGAVGDAVGIAIDAVAAAVPFVPGGVGAVRAGAKAVNAIDNAADAAKTARTGELADVVKTMGDMSETSKDASNIEFWWHTHPNITINGISLGSSNPSEADYNGQKAMVSRGYKGNSFVIGTRTNTVTFLIINDDWQQLVGKRL